MSVIMEVSKFSIDEISFKEIRLIKLALASIAGVVEIVGTVVLVVFFELLLSFPQPSMANEATVITEKYFSFMKYIQ
ncbi:hypothetical protein FORC17_1007 [Vibrio vulnificus]|nr:hypothetical protein FORC17_1007 [Vibrio vulnificus]